LLRVCQDLGRVEHLLGDGQVLRNARRAGFAPVPPADLRVLSRRSGVCWIGGGRFFWRVEELELRGVELLAALAEDPAAQRVDGLLEHGDLGVALGDLAEEKLPFFVLHLRRIP
jgi:hypothetical protein